MGSLSLHDSERGPDPYDGYFGPLCPECGAIPGEDDHKSWCGQRPCDGCGELPCECPDECLAYLARIAREREAA